MIRHNLNLNLIPFFRNCLATTTTIIRSIIFHNGSLRRVLSSIYVWKSDPQLEIDREIVLSRPSAQEKI